MKSAQILRYTYPNTVESVLICLSHCGFLVISHDKERGTLTKHYPDQTVSSGRICPVEMK